MKKVKIVLLLLFSIIFLQFNSINFKINNVKSKVYNESSEKVAYTGVVTALTNFYNSLTSASTYVLNTDKFLCTGSNISCATSAKYTKIGLINLDEFNKIGSDSYLISTNSYWTMTESGSNTYKITNSGSSLEASTNSSGVRPSLYLVNSAAITGSGYYYDPYVLE